VARPTIKIVLIDPIGWDYTPDTPRLRPLGGSQSALCYLAEALAAAGIDVTMVTATSTPGIVRGVRCVNGSAEPWRHVGEADVAVVLNGCAGPMVAALRAALPPSGRLALWTQHAADEPAVRLLDDPAVRGAWDGFVFVSEWQRDAYVARFGIAGHRCRVLRNAIGPGFAGLFGRQEDIAAAKPWPPVLAYASTPFRGLDVLLDALPAIRAAVPGTRLAVYSSLATYQVAAEVDPYADLYRRCAATDGVDYVGAVQQTELAGRLRGATALAYLNRFAETSCITVMEALAAGCVVVTSRLGALPETGAGFAWLTDVPEDRAAHAALYADRMVAVLEAHRDRRGQRLRAQVDAANADMVWPVRAAQWIAWARELLEGPVAPSVRSVALALGRCDGDEADRLCRRWLTGEPASAEAWSMLADAHLARARWTAAATFLSRAARLGRRRAPPAALVEGLALNVEGRPVGETAVAVKALADVDAAVAAELARPIGAGKPVAPDRQRTPDIVAQAVAESGAGGHLAALARLKGVIEGCGAGILVDDRIRVSIRQVIEAAERAMLADADADAASGEAAALCRLIGALADALGEDGGAMTRAAAVLDAADGKDGAIMIATAIGQRRMRQGRAADALPLLRRVRQAGGGAAIVAQQVSAGIAVAQGELLSALHALLESGQQGRGPAGWRRSAATMIEQIDGSLLLDHNGEDSRSQIWASLRGYDAWLRYTAEPIEARPVVPGRRVFDCFQFYNELDLLEMRLAELAPVVDRFVLVEARYTHAGDPKPLFFGDNRQRFAAWLDRIEHVVVEDDPGGFAWRREGHQREAIMRGLGGAGPDDIVLISDVDEIPRRETIATLRATPGELAALHLAIHLYFLDLRAPETWIAPAAAPFALVSRTGANAMRYLVKQGLGRVLPQAGWHFTWMGGLEGFRAKMRAYAHREHSGSFADGGGDIDARLERFYATGDFDGGLIPGMWTNVARVPIDDDFPASIRAEIDRFRARGWLCPAGR